MKLDQTEDPGDQEDLRDEIADLQNEIKEIEERIRDLKTVKADEREQPQDQHDREALDTGKPSFVFEGETLRMIIPESCTDFLEKNETIRITAL